MFKGLLDTYIAAQFVRILSTAWKDMAAFKLGIIDADGKILRSRKSLTTPEENAAYTMFHRLVWNIKRMVEKIPGGSTRIGSFAAAMYLLRESCTNKMDDASRLEEAFVDHLKALGIEITSNLSEDVNDYTIRPGCYYPINEDEFVPVIEALDPIGWALGHPVYRAGGVVFVQEDCTTAGIDMPDKPLGLGVVSRPKFGSADVFEVSDEIFHKCRLGKRQYARYDKYVGNDDAGEAIRQFGRSNPKAAIVLKNSTNNTMLYLRRAQS